MKVSRRRSKGETDEKDEEQEGENNANNEDGGQENA
jgi:hypothetical protein